MKNIGEQVIKLTNDALTKHGKKPLNESQVDCLKSLIVDMSSKNLMDNSVYKLLCNILSTSSFKHRNLNCCYLKFVDT